MAQQTIVASRACHLNTTGLTPAILATNSVAVSLLDSESADGIPTVGLAGASDTIYGKLDVNATNWNVLGEPTVTANGNVTYPNMAAVIVDGIVEFAFTSPGSSNIGQGIQGAASGAIAAVDDTTGKIIAYSGSTIWVDLRA